MWPDPTLVDVFPEDEKAEFLFAAAGWGYGGFFKKGPAINLHRNGTMNSRVFGQELYGRFLPYQLVLPMPDF